VADYQKDLPNLKKVAREDVVEYVRRFGSGLKGAGASDSGGSSDSQSGSEGESERRKAPNEQSPAKPKPSFCGISYHTINRTWESRG
jgi:hypothetical protein